MSERPQIPMVVPLYNETQSFPHLVKKLESVINALSIDIEVVLVDDGSKDHTVINTFQKFLL